MPDTKLSPEEVEKLIFRSFGKDTFSDRAKRVLEQAYAYSVEHNCKITDVCILAALLDDQSNMACTMLTLMDVDIDELKQIAQLVIKPNTQGMEEGYNTEGLIILDKLPSIAQWSQADPKYICTEQILLAILETICEAQRVLLTHEATHTSAIKSLQSLTNMPTVPAFRIRSNNRQDVLLDVVIDGNTADDCMDGVMEFFSHVHPNELPKACFYHTYYNPHCHWPFWVQFFLPLNAVRQKPVCELSKKVETCSSIERANSHLKREIVNNCLTRVLASLERALSYHYDTRRIHFVFDARDVAYYCHVDWQTE